MGKAISGRETRPLQVACGYAYVYMYVYESEYEYINVYVLMYVYVYAAWAAGEDVAWIVDLY